MQELPIYRVRVSCDETAEPVFDIEPVGVPHSSLGGVWYGLRQLAKGINQARTRNGERAALHEFVFKFDNPETETLLGGAIGLAQLQAALKKELSWHGWREEAPLPF